MNETTPLVVLYDEQQRMLLRLWELILRQGDARLLPDFCQDLEAFGREQARLLGEAQRRSPEAARVGWSLQTAWAGLVQEFWAASRRPQPSQLQRLRECLHARLQEAQQVLAPLLADMALRRSLPNLEIGPDLRVCAQSEERPRAGLGRHYRTALGCGPGTDPVLLLPSRAGGVVAWLPPVGEGWLDSARLEDLARARYDQAAGPALDLALRDLATSWGAEAVEMFLLQDDGLSQMLLGPAQPEPFRERTRFKLGEGLPGLVAAGHAAVVTADLPGEPRFLRPQVVRAGFKAYIGVPVWHGHSVVGVLSAAWRRRPPRPQEELLAALSWAAGPLLVAAREWLDARVSS